MREPTVFTAGASKNRMRIVGEIDMSTAPLLVDAVLQSTATDIDLSEVSFMDSNGLHALIRLRAARPSLRIVATSHPVQRVILLAGLVEHLDIDIEDAI